MPDKQHAILSASSSHRWLACPPSALECAKRPDTTSDFAREGTDAHTLCEYKVKEALGRKAQNLRGPSTITARKWLNARTTMPNSSWSGLRKQRKSARIPSSL